MKESNFMINKNYKEKYYNRKKTSLVVENFISDDFLNDMVGDIKISEYQTLFDDPYKINFQTLNSKKITRFFLSNEFSDFLKNKTGHGWKFNKKTWLQLREMNTDSPALPRHTDNQEEGNAICIFYLNKNWKVENGGELYFHTTENELIDDAILVYPNLNTLVFFQSNNDTWHSVAAVKGRTRLSIVSEWSKELC